MKTNFRIDGGAELARNLQRLERSMSRKVQLHALTKAAEPIREHGEMLAPRDEDALSPHLDENIVIGRQTERQLELRGRESETVVEVGPRAGKGGDEFFYGRLQEHGTARHGAQAFMGPAFEAEHQNALNILVDELWWALRRGTTGPERFVA